MLVATVPLYKVVYMCSVVCNPYHICAHPPASAVVTPRRRALVAACRPARISSCHASPSRMRWLGLGRKAGAAPYVAVAVGVISGNFLFAEPLKEHFAAKQSAASAPSPAGADGAKRK